MPAFYVSLALHFGHSLVWFMELMFNLSLLACFLCISGTPFWSQLCMVYETNV